MRIGTLICVLLLSISAIGATAARVRHVSDGDSFIIASGERVRMIGVNAPELKDEFGTQSKDYLTKLIRGKTVSLEGDPANDDRDVHGRLLRFVTLDGTDINRKMIADGYAYAFLRYPFAKEKRDSYREAEREAQAARIGLWARETRADQPTPTPAATVEGDIRRDEPIFSRRNVLFALGAGILIFISVIVVAIRRARS